MKGLEGENLTLKAAVVGVVTNYCLTCLSEDRRKLTISWINQYWGIKQFCEHKVFYTSFSIYRGDVFWDTHIKG